MTFSTISKEKSGKKCLLIIPLLICALQLSAQHPTSEPYLGLRVGVGPSINFADDSAFAGYDLNYKIGFSAGVYYNIPFTEKIAVQPELHYSQMGSKLDATGNEASDAEIELGYVSLPLLFKYSPAERVTFFAGPQLNLLTFAKINYDSGVDRSILNQFTGFDPVVTFGLEFWVTRNIGIYVSDVMGFANVNEKDPGIWFNDRFITGSISNFAFRAGITIGFPEGPVLSEVSDTDPE